MCGLAGEIRFDQRPASVDRVSRMARTQSRRGPDGSGIFGYGKVALGHSRLKIIDLTDRGRQPMIDAELNLTLVFNGCIYNHTEIRRKLTARGYHFFSNSDSEVILKAYHAWGEDCVEKFNGMFAIVIHDNRSGRVFMARDRLGIKPLYFIKTPGVLRFASTLPALLKTMRRVPEIDPVSLHYYMTFHSVIPAPRTIFKGINKLEPGMSRTFEPFGTYTETRYWEPDFSREFADSYLEAEQHLKSALLDELRSAVKRRMVADVPVGVLLSGGVDSSLVVGLLAEAGVPDLKTFSVGFDSVNKEDGNEFKYSDVIAKTFGTDHHKIVVSEKELLSNLPDCIQSMSEPMVSHDNIGFYLLGKYVSQHVKVVQSGQGADEIFGGYFWYREMEKQTDPVNSYASAFFDCDHDEYATAVNDELVEEDYSRRFVHSHFSRDGADHAVDKALRLDSLVMLVDDPVKRVDNMTMAWGLEARVPFLDHNVVDLGARIPPGLKIKNGGKHILKEAAKEIIPAEVIDRPKGYFPVPGLKYIRGEVLEYVRDALHSRAARERNIFKPAYIDTLLKEPDSHITRLQGSKLWQVALLELWFQSHGV